MSIFEALMLLSFGCAWPTQIYKSYTSRQNGGKSVVFLYIVIFGYICGIINKILYNRDIVMVLYFINLIMVTTDMCLYYRNKALEKRNLVEKA